MRIKMRAVGVKFDAFTDNIKAGRIFKRQQVGGGGEAVGGGG